MRRLVLTAFLWGGCAVSVGNPGEPKGRLAQLSGLVINMEDHRPLAIDIHISEYGSSASQATNSGGDGSYVFRDLDQGLYTVHVGPSFSYEIPITGVTRFDIFLPTPAAPTRFRALALETGAICLLWEDRSGLEAGFRLHGTTTDEIPANKVGIVIAGASTDVTYSLEAFNEFGASEVTSTMVGSAPVDWQDEDRCVRGHVDGYLEPAGNEATQR